MDHFLPEALEIFRSILEINETNERKANEILLKFYATKFAFPDTLLDLGRVIINKQ